MAQKVLNVQLATVFSIATFCLESRGSTGSVPTCEEPRGRTECRMRIRRLRGIVGGGIAPHHRRGRVAEQVLHVELTGMVLDRPGREGVPEAMGVGVHAGPRVRWLDLEPGW